MSDSALPSLNSPQTRGRPRLQFVVRCAVLSVATVSFWYFTLLDPTLGALRISAGIMLRLAPRASADSRIAMDSQGNWSVRVPLAIDRVQGWVAQYAPAGGRRAMIDVTLSKSTQGLFVLALPLYWAILLAAPRRGHFWRATVLGTILLATVAIFSCSVTIGHRAAPYVWDPGGSVAFVLEVGAYLAQSVVPYIAPLAVAIALLPDVRALVFPWEEENGNATSRRASDGGLKKGRHRRLSGSAAESPRR